ncbi:ribonuclease domain-containing protein [Noviherbaspirillum sp. UKPF54]|uniref:ribonuclease domain-containing protein n=1 Tax=Noviherbaspirillum sp. UKPF54 TaxID=2601898 RepID=UPI0011B14FA0|nr:ribonuclease [Noviherbaspirillum sp. UKPF54]QDZ26982.1 ribonuclease [Noviherbaspirillum sp. UKPF54]
MNAKFLRNWILVLATLLLSITVFAREVAPLGSIDAQELPKEARQTLALIKQGGPFPYAKDGVVFGNYEGVLPKRKRGYYHEFTVKTPGARNRGARRIISGGEPASSGEYYYTDDHYATFRRIRE